MLELNGTKYYIPDWIVAKNLNDNERCAWDTRDTMLGVKRETEKAVLVAAITDYGTVELWCPKSVLISEEEMERLEEEANKRCMENEKYMTYLLNTAKENGVKLGNTRKWDKVIAKLNKAGIEVVSRQDFAA